MAYAPTLTLPDGRVGRLKEPVHACPVEGDSGIMPCCGRTPFEVPHGHRITLHPDEVTCGVSIVYVFPAL